MARAPKKIDPVADFMKTAPDIWRQAIYTSLIPMARMSSDLALAQMKEKSSEITGGSKFNEVSGANPLISTVETTITKALNGRGELQKHLRIKKEGNSYKFRLIHRLSGILTLSELTASLPGAADIINNNSAASDSELFAPVVAGIREAGYDLQTIKYNDAYDVYYNPPKEEDKVFQQPSGNPNTGLILSHTLPKDFKWQTSAYKMQIGAEMYFDNTPGMREVRIDPFMELTIHPDVFQDISEADSTESKVFLALSWMSQAVHNGAVKSVKKWSALPYTDLRITSKQLGNVERTHGAARPRINSDMVAVSEYGVPVYIPKVDRCADYMKDMGKPVVDDEGYLSFEDSLERWSNQILLTDWFNDALVYTDEIGKLKVYRMHGFVELDSNSEYIFLQTPQQDVTIKDMLNTLTGICNALVTPDEAQKFLNSNYAKSDSFNGGRVTDTFGGLIMTLRLNTSKLTQTDATLIRDSAQQYSVALKHMIGQDLEELPEHLRGVAAHTHAYLKALHSKRSKIDAPVMSRLLGLEWLLIAADKADTKYPALKDESIKKRQLFKPAPLLQQVDVPNVDAGGNFYGLLPHQWKIISNRAAGTTDASMDVAAGGGKSLMLLSDILMKKLENPNWKPFILTKGRLVKGFISEINYFTKGKVNVMSLSGRLIRVMKRTLKIDTAEKFLKYIRSLPPNTIFIAGYSTTRSRSKFFNDLNVPSRVFDTEIALPQIMHLLRLIGFEMVRCDESHLVKNMKSQQAQMSYTILAQSKEKVLASGTQTHNTVVDMVGQGFGLNPMIFGRSVDAFKERYDVSSGLISLDGAQVMKRRINKFVQENVASKEDWAFLLPELVDQNLVGEMTPLQAEFYKKILQRAIVQMKAEKEGKEVPEEFKDPVFSTDDPNSPSPKDSDDEDEPDDEEEDEGDDDDEDSAFLRQLDRSLAKVEAFVSAPDENEEFVRLLPAPGPDDLISPFVKLVDAQFDRIYANLDADHWNNKSAVFGVLKSTSKHFIKHSRWASRSLHYTAGDEEKIRRFKTESDKWILVADSTALREGENLQMLSHTFMLSAPWSPGDHEQLVSRMYRPDPKGIYNKEKIYNYWVMAKQLMGMPDINAIKLARMCSKSISLAQYKYSEDQRWTRIAREFEDLDMLRMSFEFIEGARTSDLQPYFDAWKKFNDWQTQLNQTNREKFAQELEAANPGITLLDPQGRVIDRKLFTQLAMKPVVSTKTIPGSKKAYVPWERGITPPDPYDLGLVELGSQHISIGDYVVTEFGPAIVQGISKSKLLVELYGLKKVSLSRKSIGISLDKQGKEKLADMIRNPSVWRSETIGPVDILPKLDPAASLAPKGSAKVKSPKVVVPTSPPPKLEDPKNLTKPAPVKPPVKVKDPSIIKPAAKPVIDEIHTYLFNGYPALVVLDPPKKIVEDGWTIIPDFVTVTFRDWTMAEKMIDAIANKFHMSKNLYDKLNEEMDMLRSGRSLKLSRVIKDAEVRNFFRTEMTSPKEVKGVPVVHPFWISVDREVKLAFSKKSHSPTVLRWLKTIQTKNPTKVKSVIHVDGFAVNIFSNINEANEEILKIGQTFDIPESDLRDELRELKEDIKELRQPLKTPTRGKTAVKPATSRKPVTIPAPKKPAGKSAIKNIVRRSRSK